MPRPLPLFCLGLLLLAGCSAPGAGPADSSAAATTAPAEACALPGDDAAALPTQTRAVFMLDTSGSMVGLGDGRADIFAGVKAAIVRYVNERRPQALELFTFDSGLRSHHSYTLPADRAAFDRDMAALQANGNNTYLYRSLNKALPTIRPDPKQLTNVFVLTDGVDNDPARRVSAAQGLSAFQARGPLDSFHYLALGTQIPADALQAVQASRYAEARTYPVGQLPDLTSLGTRIQPVRSPEALSLNLPDGTPVQLAMPMLPRLSQVSLQKDRVESSTVPLRVLGQVPDGTAGLLCAEPDQAPAAQAQASGVQASGTATAAQAAGGVIRPQRTLLRFALSGTEGLRWLNPGADRRLRPGESVTLRYALSPAVRDKDLLGSGFNVAPAGGLSPELLYEPGSRQVGIRVTNTGLAAGQSVPLEWLLPGGTALPLTTITGGAGTLAGQVVPVADTRPGRAEPDAGPDPDSANPASAAQASGAATTARQPGKRSLWPLLLGLALLGGLLALALVARQRQQVRRRAASAAPLIAERARSTGGEERVRYVTVSQAEPVSPAAAYSPAFEQDVPTIEGLEYSEDRFLCLFGTDGRMGAVNAPASGAFDVGQVAGVPHLSGLRMERHRAGLRLLRVPADLEVSQGTRLLSPGDVVRPGTLLGLQMAESSRARTPPLGELSGLGLPLRLTSDGATLKVIGRYAEHHLGLPGGITDLGDACKAPSLRGLRVTLLGGRVLIADIPARLRLLRPRLRGEPGPNPPLRPGTFLPAGTEVQFKGYEDAE
ncbi:vWA domain-containing protein [Deinococcus sp. Marseille-Q6407]|uniref:vWA domain-containing protein n=1 Tax=Deinococcus sp. Marseille-Q6407 TaxID=2969223 RepID=UPI0021C1E667|nr:vWA domain-containing protein [Deinococcus sp. Marseille-Q6407]